MSRFRSKEIDTRQSCLSSSLQQASVTKRKSESESESTSRRPFFSLSRSGRRLIADETHRNRRRIENESKGKWGNGDGSIDGPSERWTIRFRFRTESTQKKGPNQQLDRSNGKKEKKYAYFCPQKIRCFVLGALQTRWIGSESRPWEGRRKPIKNTFLFFCPFAAMREKERKKLSAIQTATTEGKKKFFVYDKSQSSNG